MNRVFANKRFLLGVFVVLAAFLYAYGGKFFPSKPVVQTGFSGEPAPAFELPDLKGNVVTLSEQRGKVVLLTFWASWCGPCREEMPSLNRLFQTIGGADFTVLGVNIETRIAPAKRFAADFELTFPVLLDTTNKVAEQYGVFNIPQSFLIDRNGRLLHRYLGYIDWMTAENLEKLRSLIGKP